MRLFTVTAAGMDVDSRAAPEKGFKFISASPGTLLEGFVPSQPTQIHFNIKMKL